MHDATPTPILNQESLYTDFDSAQLLAGSMSLPEQIADAWTTANQEFSCDADSIDQVVVVGMGGSGLGADIALHLPDRLHKPINLVQNYTIPAFVGERSLVILASFSGTTEEILAAATMAMDKNAQIAVITGGGKLLSLAQENHWAIYQLKATFNRSKESRMALGYAIVGLWAVLVKAGALQIDQTDIDQIVNTTKSMVIQCLPDQDQAHNPAKSLALSLVDHQPIFVAADFLAGAQHAAANQWNENGKTFAEYHTIPEMNHHLLEGLKLPLSNTSQHHFVFFISDLYHQRNQKRLEVTQSGVEAQGFDTLAIKMTAGRPLAQIFELITLLSFASIYAALLHQFDPGPLPMVTEFKKELG